MKNQLFALSFIMIVAFNSYGQLQTGRTAVTFSLSDFRFSTSGSKSVSGNNSAESGKSSSFAIGTEVTMGRIGENSLFSYGLRFFVTTSKSDSDVKYRRFDVGPSVSYLKYIAITDRLFFSPYGKFNLGYQHGKTDGVDEVTRGLTSSINIYPFSCAFKLNEGLNLLFALGNVQLDFTRTKSSRQGSDAYIVSHNFGFSGALNTVGFGFQKLF